MRWAETETYDTYAAAEAAHLRTCGLNWLAYTVPLSDTALMLGGLEPIGYAEGRETGVSRPWQAERGWPFEFDHHSWTTPRSNKLLGFYRSPTSGYCLALDSYSGRTWAWLCHGIGRAT
jgi:hypothetical protein